MKKFVSQFNGENISETAEVSAIDEIESAQTKPHQKELFHAISRVDRTLWFVPK